MIEEPGPPPKRESFVEKPLDNEPVSDVQLNTESGIVLRERVKKVSNGMGYSLIFSYTQLDENGDVIKDSFGNPLILQGHEVVMLGENVAFSTEEEMQQMITRSREVSAARAVAHFSGINKMSNLMADRVGI